MQNKVDISTLSYLVGVTMAFASMILSLANVPCTGIIFGAIGGILAVFVIPRLKERK